MLRRRGPAALLACVLSLIACVLSLIACGRGDDDRLPSACREGAGAVRSALRHAPGRVEIHGTRLSECLTESSDPGDLEVVGAAYLDVAAGLARRAAAEPRGPDALRLGYLIGATRRAARGAQGVHSELLRRLEQELGAVDTGSREFRRGEAAGRRSG